MPSTLLLQLDAPMQSWGIQSNFTHRDTGLEPSKSGVIGLLCAALGKPRDEAHPDNLGKPTLKQLAALRMGVRVDREGLVKRDFHTAGKDGFLRAEGTVKIKDVITSERFYLADAAFLVGLESEDNFLLKQIDYRLHHPIWSLYLGRKAFVPGVPVWLSDGLRVGVMLENALRDYPRLRSKRNQFDEDQTRLMIEDRGTGTIIRPDQPLSFMKGKRQFTIRRLIADFCTPPEIAKDS